MIDHSAERARLSLVRWSAFLDSDGREYALVKAGPSTVEKPGRTV
jgi:hypothetical protein